MKTPWVLVIFCFFIVVGGAVPARAGEFYRNNYMEEEKEIVDRTTHEVDMELLSKVYLLSEQYKFSMTNYIPLRNLPQNDDGDVVAKRILRHTLQNFLDNYKEVPGSGVNTVVRANNNMKATVGSPKHSVLFRLRPIEGLAEAKYKGTLPIQLSYAYEIDRNESRFEISKDHDGRTYAYTRLITTDQSVDLLSVRWGF